MATVSTTLIADDDAPQQRKTVVEELPSSAHSITDDTVAADVAQDSTTLLDKKDEVGHDGEKFDEKSNKEDEDALEAESNGPTFAWFSKARLFCRINGRSHAALLDFGLASCPRCGEDLSEPIKLDSSSDGSSSYSEGSESESESPSPQSPPHGSPQGPPQCPPQGLQSPHVRYSVDYMDEGNHLIGREPRKDIFDLSELAKATSSNDNVVFEVVAVLNTSIPGNEHRFERDKRKILSNGILDNPTIAVTLSTTHIAIHSRPMIQLFRRIVRYYPSVNLEGEVLQLQEPYPLIGHYYNELDSYRTEHGTRSDAGELALDGNGDGDEEATGVKHLGILLDHFERTVLQDIRDEQVRYTRDICTFPMLWLLYKPGNTVYLESDGRLSAFVVQSVTMKPPQISRFGPKRHTSYVITVWNLSYDGRYVGREGRDVTIAPFEGERKIMSLRLLPRELMDREDSGRTRRGLEENGRKWYDLLPGGQADYSGPLPDAREKQLHGRVYVDPSSFYSEHPEDAPEPTEVQDFGERKEEEDTYDRFYRVRQNKSANCQCEECRGLRPHPPHGFPWTRYDVLDPTIERDLTIPEASEGPNHRYLLCDRLLHGFDLKSRKWVQLDIAYCKPPKRNLKAIDTLVMPAERKNIIKALIQQFTTTGPGQGAWAADFIDNKGEGRIFLLHGSPGVGKTYLTLVECIAEYTGRPLLSLTCGDIGTDEVKTESQLAKWFKLAEKWGAVMLIDEADVYLERRQSTDLHRNSLVSVFLRCIEYYRGILFLTTNRVGHFDDAFISRIQIIIHYDRLSENDRKKIWTQFFEKLDDEREDFKTTRRAKDYVLGDGEISKMTWNGREIRNAFQTAVALAEFRFAQNQDRSNSGQPTLDQRDFEQVCNMMLQFKSYLDNIHNADEEGRAFEAKARGIDD